MRKNRFQVSGVFLLLGFVGATTAVACGDTKANFGGGGSGGSAGWTFLPPGTETAGTPTTGGAGTGSGGVAGQAGTSAGAGGTIALPPIMFKCAGAKPNQPVITSFDGFTKDRWISPGNLNGGIYIYPEPLVVADGDFLRFDDKVTTYAGIGVWFAGCFDASQFDGVRFTVYGAIGSPLPLQFYAITNRNRDVDESVSVGACVPQDVADPWGTCRPPVARIPVTSEPTTVSVRWSDFASGLPNATTDGSDLLALQWSLEWTDGRSAYDAQLTIDDLTFFNDGDEPGGGGAGGAAGAGGVGGSAGSEPVGGGGAGG